MNSSFLQNAGEYRKNSSLGERLPSTPLPGTPPEVDMSVDFLPGFFSPCKRMDFYKQFKPAQPDYYSLWTKSEPPPAPCRTALALSTQAAIVSG